MRQSFISLASKKNVPSYFTFSTTSGIARVISLGGARPEGSEKKWVSGSEKKLWGKTGSEKFFGATPFKTSENAPFWKNILK